MVEPEALSTAAPTGTAKHGGGCILPLFLVAALGILGLLAGLGVGWTACQSLKSQLIEGARQRGVELSLGAITLASDQVTIESSRFRLVDVPGVAGTVGRLQLTLSGLNPEKLRIEQINVEAEGPILPLMQALEAWQKRFPAPPKEPIKLEFGRIDGVFDAKEPNVPRLTLSDLRWSKGPAQTSVSVGRVGVSMFSLEQVVFAVATGPNGFTLGWGAPQLALAPLRLGREVTEQGVRYTWQIAPFVLGDRMAQLGLSGVDPGLAKVRVSSAGYLMAAPGQDGFSGRVELALLGFVPPHPEELAGFRFAETTNIRAALAIDAGLTRVDLQGLELESGDFLLRGHGRIDRDQWALVTRVELVAKLSCVTLAAAMAEAQLGADVGAWARRNANKAIAGDVTARVQLYADTRKLSEAKLVRNIGVGCGLKPMSLEELLNLELPPLPDPNKVEQLVRRATDSGSLWPLPNLTLPSLPQLLPPSGTGRARPGAAPAGKR